MQNLRFQGQYLDAETGRHYNRFRYYDPDVGRFVSQDPMGLETGQNFYQYAPNPIAWLDPLGLKKCRPCPKECAEILEKAGRDYGRYDSVTPDSHHLIKNKAVSNLPKYTRSSAPAVQLNGPSSTIGSEYYIATQSQRQKGVGGTYAAERVVAYKALRRAGLSPEEVRCHIMRADEYFASIGVTSSTPTKIPRQ